MSNETNFAGGPVSLEQAARPRRRRLADERQSITHKFSVGGHEGYLTVGLYEDGKPGEVFITMAKEGSVISGLMDSFATSISIGLQYGVPLKIFVDKFVHMRFEPSGYTGNPEIPEAKSLIDYIFRWMGAKFLQKKEVSSIVTTRSEDAVTPVSVREAATSVQADASLCDACGSVMVRHGSQYTCFTCGSTVDSR